MNDLLSSVRIVLTPFFLSRIAIYSAQEATERITKALSILSHTV